MDSFQQKRQSIPGSRCAPPAQQCELKESDSNAEEKEQDTAASKVAARSTAQLCVKKIYLFASVEMMLLLPTEQEQQVQQKHNHYMYPSNNR